MCRYGLFAPGAVALFFSVVVLLFMKDSPEKEGFPAVDSGKPKKAAAVATPGTRPSFSVWHSCACKTRAVASLARHPGLPQDQALQYQP